MSGTFPRQLDMTAISEKRKNKRERERGGERDGENQLIQNRDRKVIQCLGLIDGQGFNRWIKIAKVTDNHRIIMKPLRRIEILFVSLNVQGSWQIWFHNRYRHQDKVPLNHDDHVTLRKKIYRDYFHARLLVASRIRGGLEAELCRLPSYIDLKQTLIIIGSLFCRQVRSRSKCGSLIVAVNRCLKDYRKSYFSCFYNHVLHRWIAHADYLIYY